jgi:hypothetical protein
MSNIRIDKNKAFKKWKPVLENMGVSDLERIDWMSEYAEYHQIKENTAYSNQGNVSGMGDVVSAQPYSIPGVTVNTAGNYVGSGDVGQNLLPVAMKIAAQTIGLDLVAVKPSPGPKMDLLYVDFEYENNPMDGDERPQLFKVNATNLSAIQTAYRAVLTTNGVIENQGGLNGTTRIYTNISTGTTNTTAPTGSKQNMVEFLGFSRIDGQVMLRAYRQVNTASSGAWSYDQTQNTFGPTATMTTAIVNLAGVTVSGTSIAMISALEDQVPGYVANWQNAQAPMSRGEDDRSYPGIIAPKMSSKTIAVGTIEISSALKRTEIEDIKANTGMDIVQKMESILVNELSQTISKQIVSKIFEMGDMNRLSAPAMTGSSSITARTIFDFDVEAYLSNNAPGGETSHALQRKLISKILNASNYLATEGRIGPAQYLVTNGNLASVLMDIAGYTINPVKSKLNGSGQLYPVGTIGEISIYVDPYMKYNDNRIVLGRKNNPDQPGIIFVPYLMAQSISIISEATFAPRILLRSRYAVSEVGWFPQKQFISIKVYDPEQRLI